MICTFYSYKGGVGRSMALANIADILSRRGLKVLMIDFDLEAPGLEQFFFRGDERERRDAVRGHCGLLDLLLAYKEAMSVAGGGDAFRDVDRYVESIFSKRPGGGRLDLMPAGQRLTPEQLAHYALALRSFDWQDFYFNWEGDLFFEWLRRALLPQRYDLVLVDSRTGVTEMGGICGYQLADVIVMMCGANHQNVDGTASMLDDFRSQPVAGLRRGRPLEIVVVPARVEQRAPQLLQAFHERFDSRFAALLPQRLRVAGLTFQDLTVPYDPQFAFEERVPRGREEQAGKELLEGVFGMLADVITLLEPGTAPAEGKLAVMAQQAAARLGARATTQTLAAIPAAPTAAAPAVQAQYDETKLFADFDVLLSVARHDVPAGNALAEALMRHGLRAMTDVADTAVSGDWTKRMALTLAHARALAVCLGDTAPGVAQQRLVSLAVQAREDGRDLTLVPVLLPGHKDALSTVAALSELPAIDLRYGIDDAAVEPLAYALRPRAAPARNKATERIAVESEERRPYVGLMSFAEHQADLFFGRAEETRALLNAVENNGLTLLVGPSGCGKTSLVQAGLFPLLRREHTDWKLVRTPGLDHIDDAFFAAFDGNALLAVDAPVQEGQVRSTIELALGHNARVLVCLRAEDWPQWAQNVADSPLASAARIDLGLPAGRALREIIERPADLAGLAFEPGLVDRILSRTEAEPGVLPFLQATLFRLWEQRRDGWLTNAAYDAFGGLRGLLIEAADRHYDALDSARKSAMRRILLRLVQVAGGSRSTAQRVRRDAIVSPDTISAEVLRGMVTAGLLVTDCDAGEPTVELAHETLARDWPRMLVWLEQERDFLAWHARLVSEIGSWQQAGRSPEQLLRGAALEEANHMSAAQADDLSPDEAAFIAASVAKRDEASAQAERARVRRNRVLAGTAALFAIIAVLAAFGWYDAARTRDEVEAQTNLLTKQLADLTSAREESDRQRAEVERHLKELQDTLDGALAAARSAVEQRDRAQAAVADLQRAVDQAQRVADQQRTNSQKSAADSARQENAIKGIRDSLGKINIPFAR